MNRAVQTNMYEQCVMFLSQVVRVLSLFVTLGIVFCLSMSVMDMKTVQMAVMKHPASVRIIIDVVFHSIIISKHLCHSFNNIFVIYLMNMIYFIIEVTSKPIRAG